MSDIDFGADNVPAKKETENNVPENTLPVLSQVGDKTIFNEKAVAFPGFSEKNIAEKLSGAKAFLASKPDLNDKETYQQLVKYQSEVVTCRTGLDGIRKGITAIYRSVTDYTNKKAKELLVEQGKLETEIKDLRSTHDAEVELIQQEAAEKERVRVQAIEDRIEEIRNLPSGMIGSSSAEISATIQILFDQSEVFLEFVSVGTTVKDGALNLLKELQKTKVAEEQQEKDKDEAEKERVKKEAAARVELDRKLKLLEIKQEAAIIKESIADFVLESPEKIKEYIITLQNKYMPCGDEREVSAASAVEILRALVAPAEQRVAVAKQAEEQETERKRLTAEKEAGEKRKAQAEANKAAEEERLRLTVEKKRAYDADCVLAEELDLTCQESTESYSVWVSEYSETTITINLGDLLTPNRLTAWLDQIKERAAEAKKLAGEAEARKAEDMGQTVADLMDCLRDLSLRCPDTVAEVIKDAIMDGEISHVTWKNE